jgi:hypothetical protein
MVPIDAFAGRSIFQLAFVVQNLEDALERYSAALDAAPWRRWTLGAVEHEETEYRVGDYISPVLFRSTPPLLSARDSGRIALAKRAAPSQTMGRSALECGVRPRA